MDVEWKDHDDHYYCNCESEMPMMIGEISHSNVVTR